MGMLRSGPFFSFLQRLLGGNAPFSGGFMPYPKCLGGNAPFFDRFLLVLAENERQYSVF